MHKDPLLANNTYHIYNRGNNRETIFKETKNYSYFLLLWKKHVNPVADTLVYSLQPNHFHFLIRTKGCEEESQQAKKVQQAFSNFFNAYSKAINTNYQRTGSLFQERFGRKVIDSDEYLSQIIWYIHSNSQKHNLVKDFRNYPHCSYQSILSNKATCLLRDYVLEWFGGTEKFIKFHELDQKICVPYLQSLEF